MGCIGRATAWQGREKVFVLKDAVKVLILSISSIFSFSAMTRAL